jgi:group I intron endonuclease
MKSGMYVIANMKTWDIYVGSSVDIPRRFKRHIRELRNGTHFNPRLQRSYNHHGESAFNFVVAKECPEKEARECEQQFLTEFCGKDFCWNVSKVVDEPNTGRKLSEEHKSRIGSTNAIRLLGRHLSEETKKKIGEESKARARWVKEGKRA